MNKKKALITTSIVTGALLAAIAITNPFENNEAQIGVPYSTLRFKNDGKSGVVFTHEGHRYSFESAPDMPNRKSMFLRFEFPDPLYLCRFTNLNHDPSQPGKVGGKLQLDISKKDELNELKFEISRDERFCVVSSLNGKEIVPTQKWDDYKVERQRTLESTPPKH